MVCKIQTLIADKSNIFVLSIYIYFYECFFFNYYSIILKGIYI